MRRKSLPDQCSVYPCSSSALQVRFQNATRSRNFVCRSLLSNGDRRSHLSARFGGDVHRVRLFLPVEYCTKELYVLFDVRGWFCQILKTLKICGYIIDMDYIFLSLSHQHPTTLVKKCPNKKVSSKNQP
jgi:hypothetical protein